MCKKDASVDSGSSDLEMRPGDSISPLIGKKKALVPLEPEEKSEE
jgi:hypothetical protein